MRALHRTLIITCTAGLILAVNACGEDGSTGGTALVSVRLTDAPGDYQSIFVDLREIALRGTSTVAAERENDDGAWVRIPVAPQRIDLLTLQNGTSIAVGTTTVAAGAYDQIRLVITGAEIVLNDGSSHELKIPSGMTSGIKIKQTMTLERDTANTLTLDFDGQASVHQNGDGSYIMQPVISVKAHLVEPR